MPQGPQLWFRLGFRHVVQVITFPLRLLMALTKATLAILCLVLLVTSLLFPVLTTTSQAFFAVASIVAEAVTSVPNLLKRQERTAAARLAQKEALMATERAAKKTAQRAAADIGANLDKALARAVIAERQTADLAVKLVSKEAALAEMVNAKVLYRGERRAIKDVVTDATQRVGIAATKMIKADISGMAGQAVPYVGGVVIVAVTAYDLDQTCAMMTALHELDVAFNPDHAIDQNEVCGMQVPTVDEILEKAKAAPGAAIDAIIDMIPDFQWEAGWKDLRARLPEFRWEEGMSDLGRYIPDFHWNEGWNDLKGMIAGDAP